MTRLATFIAVSLLLLGCGEPPTPAGGELAPLAQCGRDIDCKGDRVCNDGRCSEPTPSSGSVDSGTAIATSPPEPVALLPDPVPQCVAGDGRTPIPVWRPELDSAGNLSSAPPQGDGLIVYVAFHDGSARTTCNDEELSSFSHPDDLSDPQAGGIAVNLRGNTQFANGICYLAGYYMNEPVMGMHQGWVETYFGAIDKQQVIMSGRYCLPEPIQ